MPVKGLVDGDMSYPFDVNESILWLAELCDMVFVFFDPIGQVRARMNYNICQISTLSLQRKRLDLKKREHKTKLIWLSEK